MKIQTLFQKAIEKDASDLHLIADLPPYIRVHGELFPLDGEKALNAKEIESLAFSLIGPEQQQKFQKEKELDFAYALNHTSRFRVNLHKERGNVGLSARVIPERIPSLEEIRMPDIVKELIQRKQGLILMTGPTGCGKSTSLAAMIQRINEERGVHIITLEDPTEFIFKPQKSIIRQRQLGADMHSFAQGLKHVLRQDPNVIMVGEMRDLETMAAAITLAETGHLILTTLHTYSASQTVDRIIDSFPPHQQNQIRLQVSMTLAGVISQRLLPKQGGGLVAAREILVNTPAVANLIRENKIAQLKSSIQTGRAAGMITLDSELKQLLAEGLIDKETVELYATPEVKF